MLSRLESGESVYGLLNSVPSPLLCEMIAFAGYRFVILDMEHLLRSEEDLMHSLRACESAGISAWLRIPEVDAQLIGRALDAGFEASCYLGSKAPAKWPERSTLLISRRGENEALAADVLRASVAYRYSTTLNLPTSKARSYQ